MIMMDVEIAQGNCAVFMCTSHVYLDVMKTACFNMRDGLGQL